jgi:hypothetical protein
MSPTTVSESRDKELAHPFAATAAGRRFCVFLIGMHRSGTSLCSSILHKCGVNMVSVSTPAAFDNPKGHWERFDIVEIHDRILAALGQDWLSLQSFPAAWWRDPLLTEDKAALLDMARQLEDALPWGFKDPRTARLFPLWEEIAARLSLPMQLILCVRNPRDVAESLAKRNNFDRNYSKLLWLRHYAEFFQNRLDDNFLVVDYDDWFDDGYGVACTLTHYLGLEKTLSPLTLGAICSETITPALQHNKSAPEHDFCAFVYNKLKQAGNNAEIRQELRLIFSNIEHLNKYYTDIYRESRLYNIQKPEFEALAGRHADCENQLASLRQAETELQTRLQDQAETCAGLEADNAALQAGLTREQALSSQLQADLDAATVETGQARSETAAALQTRDDALARAQALRADLDAATAATGQARSEAAAALQTRDHALARAQALQADLDAATAATGQARSETAAALQTRDHALARAQALQTDLDAATAATGQARSEAAAARQARDHALARAQALQADLDVLAQEREHLLGDLVAVCLLAPDAGEGLVHFNEASYLAANPDVAQAVAANLVASGRQHWVRFGSLENRSVSFIDVPDPAV